MKEYDFIKGYIYKITSPDGKIYIGQTINIDQRKRRYKYEAFKGQIKLWNHCKKYNWNPITTMEIIEELYCGHGKAFINEREVFWINHYNSYILGLNSNAGGHGNLGIKHTDKTKKILSIKTIEQWSKMSDEDKNSRSLKISINNTGKKRSDASKLKTKLTKQLNPFKHTPDSKKLISNRNIGNKKRVGKKHTETTKIKISQAKKGKVIDKLCKKVYCITNNITYNSTVEASKNLHLNQGKVSMVCNGKRLSTGGYKFKFL